MHTQRATQKQSAILSKGSDNMDDIQKMCNSSLNPLDDGNPLHTQSLDQIADLQTIHETQKEKLAKANPFISRHNSSADFPQGTLITLQPESADRNFPYQNPQGKVIFTNHESERGSAGLCHEKIAENLELESIQQLDTSIVDDVDNCLDQKSQQQAQIDVKAFKNSQITPRKLLLRKNR